MVVFAGVPVLPDFVVDAVADAEPDVFVLPVVADDAVDFFVDVEVLVVDFVVAVVSFVVVLALVALAEFGV